MWSHFEGKARTLQESIDYLGTLRWTDWSPVGITLHNTSAPTLAQWAESGPSHDARIRNLESYYENELGWHAGPHWFISRNYINWFSNPLLPGVHSRCWNSTRFGIEMVGEYASEPFNSGDGAKVRDLALSWVAALNKRFGFKAEDIVFHVECKKDNHDCPGKNVVKSEVITRVRNFMNSVPTVPTPMPIPKPTTPPVVLPQKLVGVVKSPDDTLNVREVPSVQGQIVARLKDGEPVVVLGEAMNGDTKWYNIERPHNSTAWVAARYIVPV